MNVESWLWTELHDLFDTDDGSLPEIRINYPRPDTTVRGYELLCRRIREVLSKDLDYWSVTHNESRLLDSVSDAATLVVSGKAESFIVLLSIQSEGVRIPDLGVTVFPNELAIDYRRGMGWGPVELEALFYLLLELAALDLKASISHQDDERPQIAGRFQKAWNRYTSERRA